MDKAITHTLKPSDGRFDAERYLEDGSDSGFDTEGCPGDNGDSSGFNREGCPENDSDSGFNMEGCLEEEAVSPRDEPNIPPLDELNTPLSTDPEPDRPSQDQGSRSKDGECQGNPLWERQSV